MGSNLDPCPSPTVAYHVDGQLQQVVFPQQNRAQSVASTEYRGGKTARKPKLLKFVLLLYICVTEAVVIE
jgi:hypothetical protein